MRNIHQQHQTSWAKLDKYMARYKSVLQAELWVSPDATEKLATTISAEVRFLPPTAKDTIRAASPIPVRSRLDELIAFQAWVDMVRTVDDPVFVRAHVLTQNYICFVYLSEACFLALRKHVGSHSTARKCAKFLTDNPVRAFRNSIAHSNWEYRSDYNGLVYWARKGSGENEPLTRFEVDDPTLKFWQALSKCLAYATYSNLE